jgi:nucleoside-diphosphate-sugar epimerase
MRVLVTGATGFVGSHTAVALLEAGHEVRCLVRSREKLERVFGEHDLPAPEAVVGDIVDEASVKDALVGVDAVVHTAAVVAMKAYRAQEVLDTNARGVTNVVGGAVEAGIGPIVYVSSTGAIMVPDGPLMTEDAPVQAGKNAYAKSKSDGELYVRRLQADGAPIASTLPTSILGPLDPGLSEANHALRTFARDMVLLTSGCFSVIDVRDLAAMHVKLIEREPGPGRFVASAANLTWEEIGDGVDRATGVRVRRVKMGGGLLRRAGRVADVVKRVWDFDFPVTGEGMIYATQFPGADGGRAADALGLVYRDPVETFTDALRWMHAAGHIPAKHVGRLAGG